MEEGLDNFKWIVWNSKPPCGILFATTHKYIYQVTRVRVSWIGQWIHLPEESTCRGRGMVIGVSDGSYTILIWTYVALHG